MHFFYTVLLHALLYVEFTNCQTNFEDRFDYNNQNEYKDSNYRTNGQIDQLNNPSLNQNSNSFRENDFYTNGLNKESFNDITWPRTNMNDFDINYNSITGVHNSSHSNCPKFWISEDAGDGGYSSISGNQDSMCYRFFMTLKTRNEALKVCQAYNNCDLANVDSVTKHAFIIKQLLLINNNNNNNNDFNRYLISARLINNQWINNDNTNLVNENTFERDLHEQYGEYLTYAYSKTQNRWVFKPSVENEPHFFICEGNAHKLSHYIYESRSLDFGMDIKDPKYIPMGPVFIKQPVDTVFDITKKNISSGVTLSCLAVGFPTPTYEWYRQEFVNDNLTSYKIDPLASNKYTISGGNFIIHFPKKLTDRGNYHCKAINKYGSVLSNSVELSFGYILEFNLKRSGEQGNMNWGKSLYCDPPQHYPGVKYYWARDYFPNFVEEDRRVFVSFDGALYFSALEAIDRGNYSCNVQSKVSDTGRNGPFFRLQVNPHSNYQTIQFANSFPKAFPEAPVAGDQVRLECIAYGYPVPTYNWTRIGGNIPQEAYLTSYNRVLVIPEVSIKDRGTYQCTVKNDRAKISKTLDLDVQSYPVFTIPLENMILDIQSELNWLCEAVGYPSVNYTWYKNGERLETETLNEFDRDRFTIQDNILNIKHLDPEKDNGMYQCRAANQLKTLYSTAQLKVMSLKPTFKKRPLESEIYSSDNGNTTIVCNPEAAPKPKIVWKKDNVPISNGGRTRILQNGDLIISPTNRNDEGIYSCVASNPYGSDESRGRLIVLQQPRFILKPPVHILAEANQNISLLCAIVFDELLDVALVWAHNGIPIYEKRNNPRIIIDSGNLTLINMTISDNGEYECIAKSAVGQISSKTLLAIHGPPGPPGGIQVISIQKSSAVLHWTDGNRNGREIQYYNVYGRTNWNQTWAIVAEYITAKEVGRYNGRKEATVNGLTPWSVYEFKIMAINALGVGPASKPSPLYSTDNDKPYIAPRNVGGGGGKIGDLTITWEPLKPDEQNSKGIHYKVFWRRHINETEFQSLPLDGHGNTNIAVVSVPQEYYYTKYDVKVQAINDVGAGPESEPVTIYSAEDMPQVAPQGVISRGYNSTSLNVTWNPIQLSRDRIRGKLIGHRLKYWKKDNAEEDSVYYLSRSVLNHALIVGLTPDTYYFVKVMAYNSAGEGPESERYLERTYRKAPQKPPSSVNVYGVNPSTVRTVWRYVAPSLEEEPLIGYKVRVWEADQDMSTANDTIIPVGTKLEAYVTGLSPGKSYKMRVLAFSLGGDGRMSSPTLNFQMGDASAFRSTAASSAVSTYTFLIVVTMVLFLTTVH